MQSVTFWIVYFGMQFNILVPIRFSPEIRLVGICILHIDFSRFSPLTDAVTAYFKEIYING
jgi:hypothetical protein